MLAQRAHLVLEKHAQRLHKPLEAHIPGQAADVVVAFDGGAGLRAAFDDIRIDGALEQIVRAAELFCLLLEHADELLADDLALALGLGHAGEAVEKAPARVHGDDVEAELIAVEAEHLLSLVLAQQAVIHKDAGEPVAHGAVHQHAGDGGIHPAGERAQHARLPHLRAHLVDERIGKARDAVGAGTAADVLKEIAEDALALRRMRHLRMELDAVEAARIVGKGGDGAVLRGGEGAEALRQREHRVVVRHPDGLAVHAGKERAFGKADGGAAKLAHGRLAHAAAQLLRHQLHAVAHAQHGHAQLEHARVAALGVFPIGAVRPAGEDDARERVAPDAGERRVVRQQLGKDARLAYAARDELVILRAKVEHRDALRHRRPPRGKRSRSHPPRR